MEREKIEFLSSDRKAKLNKLEKFFYFLLLLFLPTQLGLHFWPNFSYIQAIRIDYLSPTLFFTDILTALLFFVFILRNLEKFKKLFLFFLRKYPFYLIFLSYLFLILPFSKNFPLSAFGLLKFIEFSFIAFYTAFNFNKYKKIFFLPFLIGIFFESALAIFETLNQGSINGIFYFFGERFFNSQTPNIANADIGGKLILRPYGTFSHPNVLSAYLLFSSIIVLSTIKTKVGKMDLLIILSIIISEIALIISLSRISLFLYSFFIPLISFMIIKYKKNIKEGILFFVLSITPLLIAFSLYTQRVLEVSGESLIKRLDIIKPTFLMISGSPIFGVGLNNFLPEITKYYHPRVFFDIQPVHNIYLLVISEIGLIGFFFFASFIIMLLLRAKKISLIVLLAILIGGFFDHFYLTLQQGQLMFAVVMGIVWAKHEFI